MKKRFFELINILALTLVALTMLLPMLNTAAKAFSEESYVTAGMVGFLPKGFQLDTVRFVIGSPEFYRSFFISVAVTLIGTLLAMLLTVTVAYPLSKTHLKGRKFFLYVYVAAMLFNAGMIPNFMLYRFLRLTNTVYALICSGMFSVLNMLIVKSYFESLPVSVEEQALIDGAGSFRILFSIVLPMSYPVIASVTLFYAVAYWGNYFAGMLYITDANLRPLPQYLYELVTAVDSTNVRYMPESDRSNLSGENVRSAAILISTLPLLLAYPFFQKAFMTGFLSGSIKE